MKKLLTLSLGFLALTIVPVLAAAPPQGLWTPRIVVIDRNALMQYSKAGQDIARQVQALGNQAKSDLAAQSKALQAEGNALQQQIAILAPDVKAKKIAAFTAKQDAFNGAAQKKEALIQGGFIKARTAMENALGQVLQQVVTQHGANMVLDKQAVLYAIPGNNFDITADAIKLLDQKLPSVKVTLAPLPPGAQLQQ